jgi:hypothetical protein
MTRAALILSFLAVSVSACASMPEPSGPADFSPIATQPSPQAALYANCIGQAVASGRYGRASDDSTDLILFTCEGEPARAFYDALAGRSAEVGSEVTVGDRTIRSTNPVQRDLFGVDYCEMEASEHRCVLSFNGGAFLQP